MMFKRFSFFFLLLILACHVSGQLQFQYGEFIVDGSKETRSPYSISVAPLSNTKVNVEVPFSHSVFFTKNNTGDRYLINVPEIYNKAKRNNYFNLQINTELVNIRKNEKYDSWSFIVADRLVATTNVSKQVIRLLNEGNKPFVGTEVGGSLPFSQMHYQAFTLKRLKNLSDKLDVEVGLSVLFGKSMASSLNNFSLFTDTNMQRLHIQANGETSSVLPLNFTQNEEGYLSSINNNYNTFRYLFNFSNPGVALDLGVVYNISKKITVKGQIENLGFIYWENNAKKSTLKIDSEWSGVDLSGVVDYKEGDFIDTTNIAILRNELFYTSVVTEDQTFRTMAPLYINLEGDYSYTDRISLKGKGEIIVSDQFVRARLYGLLDFKVNNEWNIITGLLMTNQSYLNIPLGVSHRSKKWDVDIHTSNVWGIALPQYSRLFGLECSVKYKFSHWNKKSQKNRNGLFYYPYYRQLRQQKGKGKLF